MEMDEMEVLKKKVASMSENDFIPVSEGYGNEICLYAEDFPALSKEPRGAEVMFVVRGAVKGVRDDKYGPCAIGESGGKSVPKLELYIWDAALVHGKCGEKKSGSKDMKSALMGKYSKGK